MSVQRSRQRVDDATRRFIASETTARATATAAGWSATRTVTVLMIWLAVCALTMLAALVRQSRWTPGQAHWSKAAVSRASHVLASWKLFFKWASLATFIDSKHTRLDLP